MSGPVCRVDVSATTVRDVPGSGELEIVEGRATEVGGFGVRRVLPRRGRRTVGSWCFVDHMGPGPVTATHGLDIGPHPHIGLQTVTWLIAGAVLHRDSLGTEQLIRPGELNVMTAGSGVSHSEETTGVYEGSLHGVQLWVAMPSATRGGEPGFEHHRELPQVELDNAAATVLIGDFAGAISPARRDTEHVGVELDLRVGRVAVPLRAGDEHAVIALDGAVSIGGQRLEPGRLGYLGVGRDGLTIDVTEPTRVMLIGGPPFPEAVLMWWNYVARTREEITAAHRAWSSRSPRFGTVPSPLAPMDTPGPPLSDQSG
ncbi:MAG TPA: pirin family protein [Acidimicrobiales bacterium]|nr:pirin family protein [Acidimicrobiales bacterium]